MKQKERGENSFSQKKNTFSQKESLGKILRYISVYRGYVLFSLLLAFLMVVLTLLLPFLMGKAVDQLLGKESVNFPELFSLLRMMGMLIFFTAAFQWMQNHINNLITYHVVEDMRTRAFRHIQRLPISYLDAHPAGELVSRIITDVDQFSQGLLMSFTQLFTGLMTIAGTLLILARLELRIALLVLLLTPASMLLARFIARRSYHLFKTQSEQRGELSAYINEMLGNIKVVKAFSHEEEAVRGFRKINERLSENSMRAVFFSALVNPSTRFINAIVYAVCAIVSGYFAVRGDFSVGAITAILSYANQYTKPFNEISGVITELQNSFASAARVFDFIEAPTLSAEPEDMPALENPGGAVDIDHVSFSYDKSKSLLKDLNVKILPGQTVAIVGPTGCGKSTLINLLMRFYDVDQGEIRIDGHDSRSVTRGSLRRSFGMVLQETWLKSASVRDNIAYGKEDASMEEIVRAAKLAHCDGFIRRLDQGYDTVLSEDGGALSQGQKQLLCIARLLLKLPPMLILDEATSSIDSRTEKLIQEAFDRMMEGRTSFIVAHRLSTIRNADMILVMKDGNIIEKGSHTELLEKEGFYHELYESQFDHSA